MRINFSTIIKKCRRNATILSVLEVERLINVDAIMKKMDIEGRRDRAIGALKNINFKQHFPKQIFNQLMVMLILIPFIVNIIQ